MPETPQTTPARVDEDELELARRLFDAARHGQTGLLSTFLRRGVSPDLQNTGGDTFLTLAAYHRRPETVAMLLELGADPALANDRGQLPLVCAVFKQDAQSARLLLDAGADPDAGTPTARQTAQMLGSAELTALLDGGDRDGDGAAGA
ncbi:ankyrin repeat domain-containing protein [Micrococcus sp.]|uniref:ankyrin repeat domain-containing protein n=1 Tax=Micrococcus sp. TaxID=1271 RepID=UPI0026DB0A0E|nr:ankyrin repeat domain-containing protein [Micrococcus sp.]MDO4239059.1 ankyrin repeat domain-containing protein [Micrococcus sp.]